MFSFSNALFIFAACKLVASAPIPSVSLPDPSGNDAVTDALQDFKRRADDAGLVIPPGFKPLATSSKEFLNLDTSDFKRRADDAGLVIPPGFKPLATSSKEFLNLDTSDFKRRADDAGLVIPPGFKPLTTSSKEFVNLDTSDFKRRADDAGLVIPPGFKPLATSSKEFLNLDTSDFKRSDISDGGIGPAEGSALLSHPVSDIFKRQADDAGLVLPPDFKPPVTSSKEFLRFDGSDFKRRSPGTGSMLVEEPASGGIFKRQKLDIPPDFKPALDFGSQKELVNFDSTDF